MASKEGDFVFRDGQTVVFIGDSITDSGRRDAAKPFGDGYVRKVVEMITARYPERNIQYFNKGIGGETAVELRDRWADDVLLHEPDWVSVLVGINDCNRFLIRNEPARVPPELYREAYLDCLTRTRERTGARLILMDPFYMIRRADTDSGQTTMLDTLPKYIAVVRELAHTFKAIHVPLHDVFKRQLQHRPPDTFGAEPVHPNPLGCAIIAEAFLSAIRW